MTQQIFTRCKCGGELVAFGTRCLQCGPVFPVRTGPYTQAELDRAAAACKPAGTDWQRWRLGYAIPMKGSDDGSGGPASGGPAIEVIDCFGKQHPARPADAIDDWDTVVWYRVRDDLGVIGVDLASPGMADAMAYTFSGTQKVLTLDVIDRAKKLMDETCDVKPFAYVIHADQWTPEQLAGIKQAKSVADAVDKACGLPPFGKIETKIDLRSEAMRNLAEAIKRDAVGVFTPGLLNVPRVERFSVSDFGRYVVDSKTGRKYIAIESYDRIRKLADDVARDASRPGLSRELRERAERAAGRVTAVNFTRAAPDEAIVTHLCEIVERLAGTDVAQLDQENARLRRELAAMKGSRDGWQDQARVWVSTASELRRRLDPSEDSGANVTRIEPFPDVEPYAGDWIPPCHKPRMLP